MNNPLKAVLVGCGGMSSAWINTLREIGGVNLIGFVDLNEDNARLRAGEWGGESVTGTDLSAVLGETRPDIVFDCTIPEAHHQVTLTALQHGCHVLGEKPLADSMEHAREMVEAAQKSGKIYAVIQNRRYLPQIRRVRNFLEAESIGGLTSTHCDFLLGVHFGGFRDAMQHVLLLDMAIHTFDAARFLIGADAVSVYCHEWNPQGSWYAHGASAVAIFEMSDSSVFTYRGSWCAEGLPTSWESDWRFIGTKGTAKWDGGESFQAEIVTGEEGFVRPHESVPLPEFDAGQKTGGHSGLIREFLDCIRSGRTPETHCADNLKSLSMVFAAIESARTGQRVSIPRD